MERARRIRAGVKDVSRLTGVGVNTLRRWRRQGKFDWSSLEDSGRLYAVALLLGKEGLKRFVEENVK